VRSKNVIFTFVVLVLGAVGAAAQGTSQSATGQSTSAPPPEVRWGSYIASGSVEAGYRFTDIEGAHFSCGSASAPLTCNYGGMYDTLENLHSGPRLLEETLNLRSPGHTGVLFDNLSLSSFGWGGDPQNVARFRVEKHRWYNFSGQFRRDYQSFDYNLLANPLNPPNQALPNLVLQSPHAYDTVRRMTDLSLVIAPQSVITVRLGYDRNRMEGPSFSTFHMPRGTDIELLQPYNVTTNGYRFGVDFKPFKRTTFSFDQTLRWFKNDTFWTLTDFQGTSGGAPVSLGISFNVPAGQPCAIPFTATGAVNVTCNLAFMTFRQDRARTFMPASQFAFESHGVRKLDLTGKFVYSWANLDSNFLLDWIGRTGGGNRQTTQEVPHNRRITTATDVGATYHITEHIRISNTYRFWNNRMPARGLELQTTLPVAPATPNPVGAATVTNTFLARGLFQDTQQNQTELEFDLGRWTGVNVGYRYTHRHIRHLEEAFDTDAGLSDDRVSANAGDADIGFDDFTIPQHTAIGGIWIQPSSKFRLNFDAELTSSGIRFIGNDNGTVVADVTGITTFMRISPRHEQFYRARATFQPMRNVSASASIGDNEQRNSLTDIQYRMHNRNAGFTLDVTPNDRLLVDLAYNYNDWMQNDLICFVYGFTAPVGGNTPNLTGSGPCLTDPTYLGNVGSYANQSHFGSLMLRVKPVPRVTASLGYSIVANDGGFFNTNPSPVGLVTPPPTRFTSAGQPIGPLQFNYHRPLAALEIEMTKGVALKGAWNFYDYNEKGAQPGPTLPRDFHANTGTVSLRYAF
jgi:hypothetical protein